MTIQGVTQCSLVLTHTISGSVFREEQPPHLYRLLGLQMFESDPDVIGNAADQRMALLKTFAIGNHSALSEDLLNEVARARVSLLNSSKKLTYDAKLRDSLKVPSPHVSMNHATENTYAAQGATLTANPTPLSTSPRFSEGQDRYQRETSTTQSTSEREAPFGSVVVPAIPAFRVGPIRRRGSSASLVGTIFKIIIAGFFGLAAGYFVLCIIDVRYDFLHLLKATAAPEQRDLALVERPQVPKKIVRWLQ